MKVYLSGNQKQYSIYICFWLFETYITVSKAVVDEKALNL